MAKRRFQFNKLVRDGVVDSMIDNGAEPKYRILGKKEYVKELIRKISEEGKELQKVEEKEEVIKEISDIEEIIGNLVRVLDASTEEVKKYQLQKNKKAGSFRKRMYVDHVTCDEEYEWLDYYLENPDKYPEIKSTAS